MKTKIKYLLVLVLASFVFAGCCTMHSKTAQWEYKTVRINLPDTDLQAQLNDAGKDGWKLLTIQTEQPNPGYSEYIFERPKH